MMADNDRNQQGSKIGTELGGADSNPSLRASNTNIGGTSSGTTGTQTLINSGSSSTYSTSGNGGSHDKDSANLNTDDLKRQASDVANQTKERGKSMLEQRKGDAAKQMDTIAHAFRASAEQLDKEGQGQPGRYVEMMADQIESLGRQLREKNVDELLESAQNLARRSPATFVAGSVAVGFLLARFLKSSSERRHEADSLYQADRYGRTGRQSDF